MTDDDKTNDDKTNDDTTNDDTTSVPEEVAATDTPEVADVTAEVYATDITAKPEGKAGRSIDWPRVVAFGVLPALALVLALAAGALKYQANSVSESARAGRDSARAATEATVAILSYTPDKVGQQLNDARNLLTGEFQESYTGLINDVVIPGAQQKQISAVATVPDASVVSAEPTHAVVLVFVNQTVVVGTDAPTDTASSVSVTLDKSGDKWLISAFDPV